MLRRENRPPTLRRVGGSTAGALCARAVPRLVLPGRAPSCLAYFCLALSCLAWSCTCSEVERRARGGAPSLATHEALPATRVLDGQVRGVAHVRGALPVRVEEIDSGGFTLRWDPVEHASGYEVHLGPEPPDADGLLRGGRLVAVLERAARYRVGPLAPNTHAFVQVRARVDDAEVPWGTVHLRLPHAEATRGGALSSAYAVAPDVLTVVLRQSGLDFSNGKLSGDTGERWQGGTWELERADGTPIAVRRAMRHTVVAGIEDLPIGYDRHGRTTVRLEHRIYLRLATPIGERDLLRIRHRGSNDTALDVLLPFSDRYLETPAIQVNQVGYNPLATRRWAYIYAWLGDGGALALDKLPPHAHLLVEPTKALEPRAPTDHVLHIRRRPGSQDDVGGPVAQIDLAAVPPAEGVRYRVRVPGVGVSFPTAVSKQASFKAYSTILRGLFHNRWCGDLRPESTEWSRPSDHCSAYFVGGRRQGFFPEDTERTSPRPLRGGHHDAGDFDIRPMHVLVGQMLLRAFELGGATKFTDGQLGIPESKNGIPDLLDEALWSVGAWEYLQKPDGSVRRGVESTRHPPGYYFAHEDRLPYFAYDSDAAHTAYVAGLFAQAAHLVGPFDGSRAERLQEAARRALDYARRQGAPDTYLAYAVGELSRATRDPQLRREFEERWRAVNVHGRGLFDHLQPAAKIYPGSFESQHPAMVDFVVAYLEGTPASPSIRQTTIGELRRWADRATKSLLESPQPHRSARPPGARADWGMETSQGRYLDGVYQLLQLGPLIEPERRRYFDALSLAADAMLGCNPASLSYVTGLGSRSPTQPLHLDSLAFQATRGLPPIPGLVVYGPVEHMPGADYYRPLVAGFYPPFEEQPRALRYIDAAHAVNTNEFSVWETQAPAALLFAALLPEGASPWPELAPGQPEHKSPLPPHTRP